MIWSGVAVGDFSRCRPICDTFYTIDSSSRKGMDNLYSVASGQEYSKCSDRMYVLGCSVSWKFHDLSG